MSDHNPSCSSQGLPIPAPCDCGLSVSPEPEQQPDIDALPAMGILAGEIANLRTENRVQQTTITATTIALEELDNLLREAVRGMEEREVTIAKQDAALNELRCSDCNGDGYNGQNEQGQAYSCEMCGGDEDNLGSGITQAVNWNDNPIRAALGEGE